MSRQELMELWASRIQEYRASGERAADWCRRHQVSLRQLYYWMDKLKRAGHPAGPETSPRWVAVTIQDRSAGGLPDTSPIVVRVGDTLVEVGPGFDPAVLAAVVRTLKALC